MLFNPVTSAGALVVQIVIPVCLFQRVLDAAERGTIKQQNLCLSAYHLFISISVSTVLYDFIVSSIYH